MRVFPFLPALALAVRVGASNFTYDRDSFYLDGQPLQIIGGEVQPQRVPRAYWSDRLQKAKAMGLNTIFTYLFWNGFEPQQGEWDFDDHNDIAAWFSEVQDAGLHAVLRPGPYVCGEREWGGFPGWLNNIDNMTVRANNPQFLEASQNYFDAIGEQLREYQVSRGGPILMAQVENEYGHYGSDMAYKTAIADQISSVFDLVTYTNDGASESSLLGGYIPGILALADGEDPKTAFEARDKIITDESSLGPLLDGEFYTWWFTSWGPNGKYFNFADDPDRLENFLGDTKYVLDGNNSFNLFMWHGATNWGFSNGALNFGDGYQAFTTSYDFGGPLDESGRPTQVYHDLREIISNYVPANSIPAVPESPPLQTIPKLNLTPSRMLFDDLDQFESTIGQTPTTMDSMGHYTGFVLYETRLSESLSGELKPGDMPRDRVIAYVNGVRKGVIDPIHATLNTLNLEVAEGDTLQLLVENLGRVDFSTPIADQVKGIVGDVTIGGTALQEWSSYSIPLDSIPEAVATSTTNVTSNGSPPVWYRGTITSNKTGIEGDTFLSLSGIKGVAWINGFNLGRFWVVGPQQSLYLPGYLLEEGDNELIVLDLEPTTDTFTAEGLSEREWFTNDDPDCGTCEYAGTPSAPT